jgi:hypothetical protein
MGLLGSLVYKSRPISSHLTKVKNLSRLGATTQRTIRSQIRFWAGWTPIHADVPPADRSQCRGVTPAAFSAQCFFVSRFTNQSQFLVPGLGRSVPRTGGSACSTIQIGYETSLIHADENMIQKDPTVGAPRSYNSNPMAGNDSSTLLQHTDSAGRIYFP